MMQMTKPRKSTSRKHWIGLMIGSIGIIGITVATKPEPQAALQDQRAIRVKLVSVERSSVFPVERAVGRLSPAQRAGMSFEVSGRVVERLTEPGERVFKGQPLIRLDDEDARDRLDEAEAQYKLEKETIQRDRELLELAERNTILQRAEVQRLNSLKTKALTSKSQLDAARQTLLQLEAEQARLRHLVRTAEIRLALKQTRRNQALKQLQRTTLKAPFAGTVNRVEADVGDYVSVNQLVVEIVNLDALDLRVEVRGVAIESLELGQTLTVTVNSQELPGRLHAMQLDPDLSTHTHALRIRLSGQGIRPGALASVELPRTLIKDALTVPVPAILTSNGQTFVFYHDDGVLHRRAVSLGPRIGDMQVVQKGLFERDRIVARDVAGLSDGQLVDILPGSG